MRVGGKQPNDFYDLLIPASYCSLLEAGTLLGWTSQAAARGADHNTCASGSSSLASIFCCCCSPFSPSLISQPQSSALSGCVLPPSSCSVRQLQVRNGAPVAESGRSWESCAAVEAGFISTAALVLHRRLWPSNVACYCLPCNHRSITNVTTLGDVEQPLSQDRF